MGRRSSTLRANSLLPYSAVPAGHAESDVCPRRERGSVAQDRPAVLSVNSMIVVTGATGTIGSELVRLLAERGEQVRALSRRPQNADISVPATWIQVDLADRGALPEALAGAEKLFLLTDNGEDMVRLQKNAIRAAAKAGVEHIVKLSALGATDRSKSVIGLWHYNIERELRESGITWTMLRPHHFMQNLLDQRRAIAEEGVVRSPSQEGRIPFIDARDIAAVAAEVLTRSGHEGAIHTLTGSEARPA